MDLETLHEYARTKSVVLRNRIVEDNMRIVHSVVRGFFSSGEVHRQRRSGPKPREVEDLTQAGILGLIVALEKYDPSRGVSLYIYAKTWVLSHVQEEYYRIKGIARSHREVPTGYEVATILTDGHVGEAIDGHGSRVSSAVDVGKLAAHFTRDELDVLHCLYDVDRVMSECARLGQGPRAHWRQFKDIPLPSGIDDVGHLRAVAAPLLARARGILGAT